MLAWKGSGQTWYSGSLVLFLGGVTRQRISSRALVGVVRVIFPRTTAPTSGRRARVAGIIEAVGSEAEAGADFEGFLGAGVLRIFPAMLA